MMEFLVIGMVVGGLFGFWRGLALGDRANAALAEEVRRLHGWQE